MFHFPPISCWRRLVALSFLFSCVAFGARPQTDWQHALVEEQTGPPSFDAMDANNDGIVTPEEFNAYRRLQEKRPNEIQKTCDGKGSNLGEKKVYPMQAGRFGSAIRDDGFIRQVFKGGKFDKLGIKPGKYLACFMNASNNETEEYDDESAYRYKRSRNDYFVVIVDKNCGPDFYDRFLVHPRIAFNSVNAIFRTLEIFDALVGYAVLLRLAYMAYESFSTTDQDQVLEHLGWPCWFLGKPLSLLRTPLVMCCLILYPLLEVKSYLCRVNELLSQDDAGFKQAQAALNAKNSLPKHLATFSGLAVLCYAISMIQGNPPATLLSAIPEQSAKAQFSRLCSTIMVFSTFSFFVLIAATYWESALDLCEREWLKTFFAFGNQILYGLSYFVVCIAINAPAFLIAGRLQQIEDAIPDSGAWAEKLHEPLAALVRESRSALDGMGGIILAFSVPVLVRGINALFYAYFVVITIASTQGKLQRAIYNGQDVLFSAFLISPLLHAPVLISIAKRNFRDALNKAEMGDVDLEIKLLAVDRILDKCNYGAGFGFVFLRTILIDKEFLLSWGAKILLVSGTLFIFARDAYYIETGENVHEDISRNNSKMLGKILIAIDDIQTRIF